MNRRFHFTTRKINFFRVSPLANPRRGTSKSLVAAALLVALLSGGNARADSFFDIFVDLWDSGQVVMQPVNSDGAFPFPPPPLNFPDLGAAGTIWPIRLAAAAGRRSATSTSTRSTTSTTRWPKPAPCNTRRRAKPTPPPPCARTSGSAAAAARRRSSNSSNPPASSAPSTPPASARSSPRPASASKSEFARGRPPETTLKRLEIPAHRG